MSHGAWRGTIVGYIYCHQEQTMHQNCWRLLWGIVSPWANKSTYAMYLGLRANVKPVLATHNFVLAIGYLKIVGPQNLCEQSSDGPEHRINRSALLLPILDAGSMEHQGRFAWHGFIIVHILTNEFILSWLGCVTSGFLYYWWVLYRSNKFWNCPRVVLLWTVMFVLLFGRVSCFKDF